MIMVYLGLTQKIERSHFIWIDINAKKLLADDTIESTLSTPIWSGKYSQS